MRRKISVRGRDGVIRIVDEGYVLLPGETLSVPVSFMDARHMVHDGRGNPAGQRPGFLCSNASAAVEQALADAYAEYDATIRARWRQQPQPPAGQTQSHFDSPAAAVAAAYADYEARICGAWRR